MIFLLQIIVVVLAFISQEQETMAVYPPPYSSVVAPVYKHTDAAKPLFRVQIMTAYDNNHYRYYKYLIDIDAPFTWHNCILEWRSNYQDICPINKLCAYPVACYEYQCDDARTTYSYKNTSCSRSPVTKNPILPGWLDCTCPVNVINPVTGSCGEAVLNVDSFTLHMSNGRDISPGYGVNPTAACAPSSAFQAFPVNVSGVMAFSSSAYAFPAYLYHPLKKILSLCFPSTLSARGVLFYGTGPYYLRPQSNVDIRSLLTYTPLLKQPNSFGYFISGNSIIIKNRSTIVPANTFTKLSTIDPYTTLRTDIYNSMIRRFSMVTKRIPTAKPIAPFGLCYQASSNNTKVTVRVPDIDLIVQDGKKWTISTANSMKQMTNDVACLAFVDGGATSEPAIVIGTLQFENNFLVFDLENSTFGFSSSLLRKKTSCSNFNFTLTNE